MKQKPVVTYRAQKHSNKYNGYCLKNQSIHIAETKSTIFLNLSNSRLLVVGLMVGKYFWIMLNLHVISCRLQS